MADTSDDSGTEWYAEPVTIVGFVAGFLLLVLVIASVLILCYSKEEEEEDDDDKKEEGQPGQVGQRGPMGQPSTEHSREEQRDTRNVADRTNPLYTSANEFNLQPFPYGIRAKFVHIHIDEETPRGAFQAYYNK